jgi:ribosome recycling factor
MLLTESNEEKKTAMKMVRRDTNDKLQCRNKVKRTAEITLIF